jgi:hypothetical protein
VSVEHTYMCSARQCSPRAGSSTYANLVFRFERPSLSQINPGRSGAPLEHLAICASETRPCCMIDSTYVGKQTHHPFFPPYRSRTDLHLCPSPLTNHVSEVDLRPCHRVDRWSAWLLKPCLWPLRHASTCTFTPRHSPNPPMAVLLRRRERGAAGATTLAHHERRLGLICEPGPRGDAAVGIGRVPGERGKRCCIVEKDKKEEEDDRTEDRRSAPPQTCNSLSGVSQRHAACCPGSSASRSQPDFVSKCGCYLFLYPERRLGIHGLS